MADDSTEQSLFQRLRQPAALNYLAMMGVGLIIYFMIMSSRSADIIAYIAILIALTGSNNAPAIVLMLTAYGLYDPAMIGLSNLLTTGRYRPFDNPTRFNIEDLILAMGLLAYTIGHYRLYGLIRQSMPYEPGPRRLGPAKHPPRRPVTNVTTEELPRSIFVAVSAVVVGQLIWILLVQYERGTRPHLYNAGSMRLLYFTFGASAILMLIMSVQIYWKMNRQSRAESEMYLRDICLMQNLRETDRIFRWRRWWRERQERRRAKYKK